MMIWLFEPEFGLEYMIRLDMKTVKYIVKLWIEYGKKWDVGNGMICQDEKITSFSWSILL